MEREAFGRWLEAYFDGTAADIGDLPLDMRGAPFEQRVWMALRTIPPGQTTSYGAIYAVGPFADVWEGRHEIVRWWTSVAQDDVEYSYEVLAAEGETGIAHWNVKARPEGEPYRVEWDGILLITFAPDGRCRDHREWLVRRELPAR